MRLSSFIFSLTMLHCASGEDVPKDPGPSDASSDTSSDASGGTGGVVTEAGFGGTGGTAGTGGGSGGGASCSPPSGSPCDTFPQCNCEAGLACDVVDETGATDCVAPGTIEAFRTCSGPSTCAAGLGCVGGVCKPHCESGGDCSPGKCIQVEAPGGGPIPGFKVCTAGCSLTTPALLCGSGLGCFPDETTPTGTDCAPAGTGTGVDGCTSSAGSADPTACAPGYACVAGATATNWDCRKWCRVGFATDCPAAGVCAGFPPGSELFFDGLEYGVCPP